jgi:hypothetical protein
LLVQTIEKATNLRISGYVEIGFGGFVQMVDAVGTYPRAWTPSRFWGPAGRFV